MNDLELEMARVEYVDIITNFLFMIKPGTAPGIAATLYKEDSEKARWLLRALVDMNAQYSIPALLRKQADAN